MIVLAALLLLQTQTVKTMPGVTVRAWDCGDPIDRFPTIREGQPANAYFVTDKVDLKAQIDSQEGPLKTNFVGEVRAWLDIKEAGAYRFRLACDDGAKLIIDGKEICETKNLSGFRAEDEVTLKPGLHPVKIPFFQKGGNFYVTLSWQTPGSKDMVVVPTDAWKTEGGQTFVVAPGPKKWFYGNDPNRPGDGRPEEDVHPSMTLENFRGPDFKPGVGAMAFLPDGRLALATWDPSGSIYFLSNLDGPGPVKVHRFAQGFGEPLGMKWWKGALYVTQKEEVTKVTDTDGDDVADRYECVATGWPASQNYHEFTFNLVPLNDKLYISTSVPLKSGVTNYSPGSRSAYANGNGPGSIIEIDPEKKTWRRYAHGARTPNGMNVGYDGLIYFCDNQGAWMPASRMNVLREGAFYGHQDTPTGTEVMDPPVVWFPHGEIGNSPTEMVLVPDGLYRQQMLVGDVTHGGVKRVFIEKVAGTLQGCVFRYSEGIEAGVNRLVWGPDGCLYVGGVGADGDWNHMGHKFGLQRLRPNDKVPFEMLKVETVHRGFRVTFTKPAGPEALDPAHWQVRQWRYLPTLQYGGAKLDEKTLPIEKIMKTAANQVVILVDGLKAGSVAYLRMKDIRSAQKELPWVTEAWYTLNNLAPSMQAANEPIRRTPEPPVPAKPANAKSLSSLSHWQMKDDSPAKWKAKSGEFVVEQSAGDIVTKEAYGDCRLHVEWMSPPGGPAGSQLQGNSGIKLMSRYEIQVLGNPAGTLGKDLAGAIYNQRAPLFSPGFGPGVWQSYDIVFTAPKFVGGKKTANARITMWWNGRLVHENVEIPDKTGASETEAPGKFPLLLQAHESKAEGDVRFRNIWIVAR